MRIFLEILLLGLLAFMGWRQPFRDVVRSRFPDSGVEPSRLAVRTLEAESRAAEATRGGNGGDAPAGRRGDWMFSEPGALDARPAPRK
jgi:hypothetical protein